MPKDHLRVQAMGDVDELNSQLGVLLAEPLPDDVRELLVVIQHELFNLGGELSIPGYELLKAEAVPRLDDGAGAHNATLPRLAEFILPAGTRSAALAHVAAPWRAAPNARWSRWRARPGQRGAAPVPEPPVSDLLFVLARVLNRANLDGLGGDDVYWQQRAAGARQPDAPSARACRSAARARRHRVAPAPAAPRPSRPSRCRRR